MILIDEVVVPLALASALSDPYALPRLEFYNVPREQPAITMPSSGGAPLIERNLLTAAVATRYLPNSSHLF